MTKNGVSYIAFENIPLENFSNKLPIMNVTDHDAAYIIASMEAEGRHEEAREFERDWLEIRAKYGKPI